MAGKSKTEIDKEWIQLSFCLTELGMFKREL